MLASADFTSVGLRVQALNDHALQFLLVTSRFDAEQSMLLVTGPDTPPRGLSAYSRHGRWHAVHWALVWGWGPPPQGDLVFTSRDLRFRREARASVRSLSSGWLAVCEGAFTGACLAGASDRDCWLELAPQW